MTERLSKLMTMLEKSPADAFLLYAAAMEHKKSGQLEQAIQYLNRTLSADAGYCYAYFQRGQVYELMGDSISARKAYEEGIDAARRKGDSHAAEELNGALSQLG